MAGLLLRFYIESSLSFLSIYCSIKNPKAIAALIALQPDQTSTQLKTENEKKTTAESSVMATNRARLTIRPRWDIQRLANPDTTNNRRDVKEMIDERFCAICMESFPRSAVARFHCEHYFCRDCLTQMFVGATKDESQYPPKCCRQRMSYRGAEPLLERGVAAAYREKAREYECNDKVYCSNKKCGAFIRMEWRAGKMGRCGKCGEKTCLGCKNRWHGEEGKCVIEEEERKTLELLKRKGWKWCVWCGVAVEKVGGSNEMM